MKFYNPPTPSKLISSNYQKIKKILKKGIMSEEQKEQEKKGGMQLLPFTFLKEALQKSGLPFSKPTIIKYEKMGVIHPGINSVMRKRRIDRYYTMEEIGSVIRSLKEFVESHKSLQSRKIIE